MEIWIRNSDGKEFESMEEAYDDYCATEDTEYLFDILYEEKLIDPYELFKWAVDQPGFWEAFQDEIAQAREECFEETYACWEYADYESYLDSLGEVENDE